MRRWRCAAAALATALVLLQYLAAPAQAGRLGLRDEGSPPALESPRLGAIHFAEMESIDPFERSQKQEVEDAGEHGELASEPGLQEEGEKKETIAEVSELFRGIAGHARTLQAAAAVPCCQLPPAPLRTGSWQVPQGRRNWGRAYHPRIPSRKACRPLK